MATINMATIRAGSAALFSWRGKPPLADAAVAVRGPASTSMMPMNEITSAKSRRNGA
jgi:hypothetical protein